MPFRDLDDITWVQRRCPKARILEPKRCGGVIAILCARREAVPKVLPGAGLHPGVPGARQPVQGVRGQEPQRWRPAMKCQGSV